MCRLRLSTILIAVYLLIPPLWLLGEEAVQSVVTAIENSRVRAAVERIAVGMTRAEVQAVLHEEGVDEWRVRWEGEELELVTDYSINDRSLHRSSSWSTSVYLLRSGRVYSQRAASFSGNMTICHIGHDPDYWPNYLKWLYAIETLPMALLGTLLAIRDRHPRRRHQRRRSLVGGSLESVR